MLACFISADWDGFELDKVDADEFGEEVDDGEESGGVADAEDGEEDDDAIFDNKFKFSYLLQSF